MQKIKKIIDFGNYVGLSYKAKGRTTDALDCYGLVRLVYKQELGIDLPSFDTDYEENDESRMEQLLIQYREGWEKIDNPETGSVVLFRVMGSESHIGVAVSAQSFLHVRENMDSVVEDFSNPRWNKRIVGHYKYVEQSQASMVGIPHPLRTEAYSAPVMAGTTLSEIATQITAQFEFGNEQDSHLVIMINGAPIAQEQWSSTKVQIGDAVEYRRLPGKGGLRQLAIIVLILVVTYFTAGAGTASAAGSLGATGFGTGVALSAGTAAVVQVGAIMALQAIAQSMSPARTSLAMGDPGSSERQLMVTGATNQATPYGSIPFVLGRIRMNPLLGAQNFLSFENGRDSYLSMLLIWGFGPLKIHTETFKFGEVPIANYTGLTIKTLERISSETQADMKYLDSIYGNSVDYKDLNQVIICTGSPETPVPRGPWITSSTLSSPDNVTLSVHFPEGLRVISTISGVTYGTNVYFDVERSIDGVVWESVEQFSATPPLSKVIDTSYYEFLPDDGGSVFVPRRITEFYTQQFKDAFTINRTYATSGNYKYIRIRRATGDNPEPRSGLRWFFSSYLKGISFTSNINPAADPPNCKIAKTALKIKSSEQLNGSLEGLNGIVHSFAPTWNGLVWVDAPTSNPASLFMLVLLSSAGPRPRTMSQLNLPELVEFYNYCESKGFKYNSVIANQQSENEILKDICAAGRASPTLKDGKHSVIIDREKQITQHFTQHNSWGFQAVKNLPEIPHGLKVKFRDEDKGFQDSEIIVYNIGYSTSNASLFEAISFAGITKSSLVIDHARWHLAQIKLRPEVYELNLDVEYLTANRGDRCKVMHDVPMWGLGSARIKNKISGTVLELDDDFPIELGKSYTIRIRSDLGVSTVLPVLNPGVSGYYSTITLSSSVTDVLAKAGDLCLFGELNRESQDVIVASVEPAENMSARLTLLDYGVTDTYNIFNDYLNLSATTVFQTNITLPPEIQIQAFGLKKPTITTMLSDESVMTVISKGVFAYNMNVGYTNALDLPRNTSTVEAQYDLASSVDTDSAKIVSTPFGRGTVSISDIVQGEQYRVRVRYTSEDGRVGLWSGYTTHFVIGATSRPNPVVNFTAASEVSLGKVKLSWNKNLEQDLRGYEVRTNVNFGQQTGLISLGEEITCFAIPPDLPGQSKTYWIAAVDFQGNYSSKAEKVVYTYPLVNEVSGINWNFSDDSLTSAVITFNWITPNTEYSVNYYEVISNGVTKEVKGNSITLPANWLGNRSFVIKTVDILGNKSTGLDNTVIKFSPNPVLNYRNQVIDNDVMLFWTLPLKTTLPIDHVEIRKGNTWATAAKIGDKKGEFTTVIELKAGNYTYWIATVDTDDNYSTPVSLTTQVAEPPDFEFFATFNSSFNGLYSNAVKSLNGAILPVNNTETWSQHFSSRTWAATENQVNSGYPIYSQPTVTSGYYEEVFDYGILLASSKITVDFTGNNIVGVSSIGTSVGFSTDNINYTTYGGSNSIFATNFRYVRVRVTATNTDDKALYEITGIQVTLDAKKKYDSFNLAALATDTLGTIANFTKEFIDVQTIGCTAAGTTPLTVVRDFKDFVFTATYVVTGNVCTVTANSHGLITGQKARFGNLTGAGLTGVYLITSSTTNTFTFAMTVANTSGTSSVYPESCRVYVFNSSGARVSTDVSVDVSGY